MFSASTPFLQRLLYSCPCNKGYLDINLDPIHIRLLSRFSLIKRQLPNGPNGYQAAVLTHVLLDSSILVVAKTRFYQAVTTTFGTSPVVVYPLASHHLCYNNYTTYMSYLSSLSTRSALCLQEVQIAFPQFVDAALQIPSLHSCSSGLSAIL